MKILMKATFAGPSVFWGADTVQDVRDDEGRALIAAGYAEAVEDDAPEPEPEPVERAVNPAPARAEVRPGRATRKRK